MALGPGRPVAHSISRAPGTGSGSSCEIQARQLARGAKQPVVLLLGYTVGALARKDEAVAVQNADSPPACPDQLFLLKNVSGNRDSGAPYAKQVRQKLVSEKDLIPV